MQILLKIKWYKYRTPSFKGLNVEDGFYYVPKIT